MPGTFPVSHPSTGHVCLGFLTGKNLLPTCCIRDVLRGVFALLIKPEPENAADQTLLNMFNDNKMARMISFFSFSSSSCSLLLKVS